MSTRPRISAGAVLLGLVAAALIGAIVVLTVSRAGSGGDAPAAARSVADRLPGVASPAPTQPRATATAVPTATPGAAAAPAISREAVLAVLQAYVQAFDAEDPAALGALLAPDVSRHSGRSVQHGAAEALAEYQRQFDTLVAPHYVLDNLAFASTAADARAGATYSITSARAQPAPARSASTCRGPATVSSSTRSPRCRTEPVSRAGPGAGALGERAGPVDEGVRRLGRSV